MELNSFKEMIWQLYPKGLAWNREQGLLDSFNESAAAELQKIDERTLALVREADPRKTEELIGDWENDFGLPDECTPLAATLEGRRQAVVAKINLRGCMTPAWYKRLANDLGYDVDLVEWRPFVCGLSQTGAPGDMCGNEDVRCVWSFTIYGATQSFFVAGVSQCGDPLGSWKDAAELICRINKLKPSHTVVYFYYEGVRK